MILLLLKQWKVWVTPGTITVLCCITICIPDSTNALLQIELSFKSLSPEEGYIIKVAFYIMNKRLLAVVKQNIYSVFFLMWLKISTLNSASGNRQFNNITESLVSKVSHTPVNLVLPWCYCGQGRKTKKERKSNPELIDCFVFF